MDFFQQIIKLFSTGRYWLMLLEGLGITIVISIFAAIIGLILGTVVAMTLIAKDSKAMKIPKAICNAYVTIIRGTPMALQLFIMINVIFTIRGFPPELTAIIAFGINSGAYVAETIRAGILSVDIGQTEACRALGLTQKKTMMKVVIPQAIKNVIPAIGNELVALIKETSIVYMFGIYDLTMVATIIGGGNEMSSYLIPMCVVALFYLGIVYLLTYCISIIEKRLRASDKR